MLDKFKMIKSYAIVGWAVFDQKYTLEELDNMSNMEVLMLTNDFDRFIEEACKNG